MMVGIVHKGLDGGTHTITAFTYPYHPCSSCLLTDHIITFMGVRKFNKPFMVLKSHRKAVSFIQKKPVPPGIQSANVQCWHVVNTWHLGNIIHYYKQCSKNSQADT